MSHLDSALSGFAGAMVDALVNYIDVPSTALAVYRIIFKILVLIGMGTVCSFVGRFLPEIDVIWLKRIVYAFGCSIMLTVGVGFCQLGLILMIIVFFVALFFAKYVESEPGSNAWMLAGVQSQSRVTF